jgi:demethoxyubiquinone hydroxylase (CLK1/Coq7/Cat5 family)
MGPLPDPGPRKRLIRLLKRAHAGERAAALAYRGHWRSLADPEERHRVRRIELEEWHHRDELTRLLSELGSTPSGPRGSVAFAVGSALGALCHVSGWLLPMYAAALLETCNVREYEEAGRLARLAGRSDLSPCLREMTRVELDHEAFFHARVVSHPLGRRLPGVRRSTGGSGMGEWAGAAD